MAQTTELAGQRFADLQDRSEKQAKSAADDVTMFVRSLPEQVKALPETTKARLAEWQKQAQDLVREANTAYGDLAGRGKKAVDETARPARQLLGPGREAGHRRRGPTWPTRSTRPSRRCRRRVTRARKTVTGRTATETVTPRSTPEGHRHPGRRPRCRATERPPPRRRPRKKAAAEGPAPPS